MRAMHARDRTGNGESDAACNPEQRHARRPTDRRITRHAVLCLRSDANLQQALERWDEVAGDLQAATAFSEPLVLDQLLAPLPRAWQWLDGSVYSSHGADGQGARNRAFQADWPLMCPTRSTAPGERPHGGRDAGDRFRRRVRHHYRCGAAEQARPAVGGARRLPLPHWVRTGPSRPRHRSSAAQAAARYPKG